MEEGFYDPENLPTLATLLNNAYTYMLCFDLERVNLNLKRSPFQMVRERNHTETLTSWTFHKRSAWSVAVGYGEANS